MALISRIYNLTNHPLRWKRKKARLHNQICLLNNGEIKCLDLYLTDTKHAKHKRTHLFKIGNLWREEPCIN